MPVRRILASWIYVNIISLENERHRQGSSEHADDNNSGYNFSASKHRHIVPNHLCINSHEAY
jgi:hypothetical protein